MAEGSGRLDSWKAIADYLGRDVRTAMRWAKSQGMPVRRVGGRGRSVFAFRDEIDLWLGRADAPGAVAAPRNAEPVPVEHRAVAPEVVHRLPRLRLALAATSILLLIAAATVLRERMTERSPSRAFTTDVGVVVVDSRGAERAIYAFDPAEQMVESKAPPVIADLDGDGRAEVTVGVSSYIDPQRRAARAGEVLSLSPRGGVKWRFTFDDRVTFRERSFAGPWLLTDWQIEPAGPRPRVAIAAHDHTWWPSVVAVLDGAGRRLHTFVNPGWIESLFWVDARRLAIAGFNNARDAAAVAVLDPTQPTAAAPHTGGSPFDCLSCPDTAPEFYATLPRSELNRLTGSRFNRAAVVRRANRLVVTTIEMSDETLVAAAIYEFDDATYALTGTRYDDVYWDTHRRLELEGRLGHSREACPERDGPGAIHVWKASEGWVRIASPR